MNFLMGLGGFGVVGFTALVMLARSPGSVLTGTVQRVWEDGFQLQTGDRTLTVDTWELCGDFTPQYLTPGDTVSLTGEFEGGEFDAFTLTHADGTAACTVTTTAAPATTSLPPVGTIAPSDPVLTGTVQRVWEDGFQLQTGDRTLTVDTWELCGDFTPQYLTPGDTVSLTGEFEGGEFDAFTLTSDVGAQICH